MVMMNTQDSAVSIHKEGKVRFVHHVNNLANPIIYAFHQIPIESIHMQRVSYATKFPTKMWENSRTLNLGKLRKMN